MSAARRRFKTGVGVDVGLGVGVGVDVKPVVVLVMMSTSMLKLMILSMFRPVSSQDVGAGGGSRGARTEVSQRPFSARAPGQEAEAGGAGGRGGRG